jgi:hypothetical protein
MKPSLVAFCSVVLLSACGSPHGAATGAQGANATTGCPQWNGLYLSEAVKDETGAEVRHGSDIKTKVENGTIYYAFWNGDFYPANGSPQALRNDEGVSVSLTMTCDTRTVRLTASAGTMSVRMTYTDLGGDQIDSMVDGKRFILKKVQ